MVDLEKFREYCLSFEGVEERTPFGKFAARFDSILVFYVCGHIFCLLDMYDFKAVTVKGRPERVAELLSNRTSCGSHRNMSPRHWIELRFNGDISEAEILQMVADSYTLVREKYSKRSAKK